MSTPKSSQTLIANHVLVSGTVQGVNYRQSLAREANALNIKGWCRNLKDGRVEAFLQGNETSMQQLLAWMEKGPSQAQVESVFCEPQAVLEPLLSQTIALFEIRQ